MSAACGALTHHPFGFLVAELLCFGIIALTYPLDVLLYRLPDLLHHCEALLLGSLAYGALFAFIGVVLPRFSLLVSIAYGALKRALKGDSPPATGVRGG